MTHYQLAEGTSFTLNCQECHKGLQWCGAQHGGIEPAHVGAMLHTFMLEHDGHTVKMRVRPPCAEPEPLPIATVAMKFDGTPPTVEEYKPWTFSPPPQPPKAPEVAQYFKPCPDPLTLRPDAHLPKPYGDEAPAGPVQRWNLTSRTGFPSMLETEAGPWVRYADIAPYLAPGPREDTARLRDLLERARSELGYHDRDDMGYKRGSVVEIIEEIDAALAQPGGGK